MSKRILNLQDLLFGDQQLKNGGQTSNGSVARKGMKFNNGGSFTSNVDDGALAMRRKRYLEGLSPEQLIDYSRRQEVDDLRNRDRNADFFRTTWTSQLQKALPNVEDRMNPQKVANFRDNTYRDQDLLNQIDNVKNQRPITQFNNGGSLEARRLDHIHNLAATGSDQDLLNFEKRIMVQDLKERDRDADFFPSTFTGQLQKALPNVEDRQNPQKVRQFMTDFQSAPDLKKQIAREEVGMRVVPRQFKRGGYLKAQDGISMVDLEGINSVPIGSINNLQNIPLEDNRLVGIQNQPSSRSFNEIAGNVGRAIGEGARRTGHFIGEGAQSLRNNPELTSNLLSGASYLVNRNRVNRMETDFTPNTIAPESFNFTDTTSARERKNAEAARQAFNNINASSTQGQAAAKAAILGQRLRADNQVNISEQQRRDAALDRFNARNFRRSAINANMLNQAEQRNIASRNQQRALRGEALNRLIGDIQANRQTSIVNQGEKDKMLLTSLMQADRGTVDRFIEQNPDLAKRIGLIQ
jgi:hypothetical protein